MLRINTGSSTHTHTTTHTNVHTHTHIHTYTNEDTYTNKHTLILTRIRSDMLRINKGSSGVVFWNDVQENALYLAASQDAGKLFYKLSSLNTTATTTCILLAFLCSLAGLICWLARLILRVPVNAPFPHPDQTR
jgi:hypothetical protein